MGFLATEIAEVESTRRGTLPNSRPKFSLLPVGGPLARRRSFVSARRGLTSIDNHSSSERNEAGPLALNYLALANEISDISEWSNKIRSVCFFASTK